ncbi:adenylosuccinate lyase [bacterium]|nr:adenylosuccinate lyase [bacterium]
MIARYTRDEMGKIWGRENKFAKWLEIELAVCEALTDEKEITKKVFKQIKKDAAFDLKRIDELEEKSQHEMIAFLNSVAEKVGENSDYIHKGLTSSDIMDTALALQMKEAGKIILEDLKKLNKVIKNLAMEHRYTPIIGRTHGIHAEPTTFGLKVALWYDEMRRNIERVKNAIEAVSFGMLSGAVGNFAQVNPSIEEKVCKKLGLKPAPITNQVIARDGHAEYIFSLALVASTIEKIALEIRGLQRTEVLELEEPFSPTQKGSSAMPHKRNPILSERLCGLSRLVRSTVVPALENIPLWHERDISHSSAERVIVPDATILIDYMLNMLYKIMDGLLVYPEKMRENIERTKGLVFSQRLMLRLVQAGLSRDKAYTLIQGKIMTSWMEDKDFKEQIYQDGEIRKYLSIEEIESIFHLDVYFQNVDYIFKRVFGKDA